MRCTARTWTRLTAKGSAEAKAGGGENRKAAGGNVQGETTDHAEYTDLEKDGDFEQEVTEEMEFWDSGNRAVQPQMNADERRYPGFKAPHFNIQAPEKLQAASFKPHLIQQQQQERERGGDGFTTDFPDGTDGENSLSPIAGRDGGPLAALRRLTR